MWPNPHFPADLATFSEEIHNGIIFYAYNNKPSSLEANEKDDFVSINIKRLQTLAIEMYEVIRFSCNYDWGFRFREESI